jgi:hypothetical protein
MAIPYTISMDRLFANQANLNPDYGDMDAESQRIKEEEQLRADLARQQVLGIATTPMSLSSINEFAPAEMVQSEFPIPNAQPYSQLTARQAPSSIVGGMFSPEISRAAEMEYMQRRQATMQNEAMAFAQLSPMQQAQFGFYRGGQQLGDVLGGALGGKDPQLQMIGLQQQILSELDPSNPEQNLMVAQKYARTAPDLAMKIADNARGSLVKIAQANKERKLSISQPLQVATRIREINAAQRNLSKDSPEYQDLELEKTQLQKSEKVDRPYEFEVKAQKLTDLKEQLRKAQTAPNPDTASIQKLKDNIQAIEGTQKRPTEEIFDLMAELDVLDPVKDKKKYDIVQLRIKKLTEGKSLDEALGEGLGMLGKALMAGQKKEAEETGKYTAENFKNLGSAVAAGTASKRNIATLETSLENAFTGKFAEGKEAVVGALISLGIPVGSDLKNATSNTQLIQAMGTRYIFPLVKNYPGSLAAKELASLEKTAPNALQQPETIKRLVSLLKVDLAENEYTYNRAKDYKKANKDSLMGFNEADQRIEFQNKLGRLQELVTNVKRKKSKTPEEDAEINQLKKELYIGG